MISFVGCNSGNGNSIQVPAHKPGDVLLMFAFQRNYTSTINNPLVPSSWISAGIATSGYSGDIRPGCTLGYKVAETSQEVSGTWTQAEFLVCAVYRSDNVLKPILGLYNSTVDKQMNFVFEGVNDKTSQSGLSFPVYFMIGQIGGTYTFAANISPWVKRHDNQSGLAPAWVFDAGTTYQTLANVTAISSIDSSYWTPKAKVVLCELGSYPVVNAPVSPFTQDVLQ